MLWQDLRRFSLVGTRRESLVTAIFQRLYSCCGLLGVPRFCRTGIRIAHLRESAIGTSHERPLFLRLAVGYNSVLIGPECLAVWSFDLVWLALGEAYML